uniref:Uncharacterized protein n=1 Tax=Arundo donax TaxID=35708 RepID=A0A0A9DWS7_ARUDO
MHSYHTLNCFTFPSIMLLCDSFSTSIST